jgi:excisionase family DNA binding protein
MTTNTTDKSEPGGKVLTVADAALFLRISESIVRRLIRERRIPYFKIDGRYLFYRPGLEEWITQISIIPEGRSAAEQGTDKAAQLWEKKEGLK